MQYTEYIFSLLFFLVFFIYLFLGIYVIKLNPKSNINKMFLLICISLSIWSFGFSMANSANDIDSALFWRRFAAIGWTSLYSFGLHFIIILTKDKLNTISNWLLTIIHIPAIICMYIFSISYDMSVLQYNLVKTDFGWTNIINNNIYDWFFNLYYIIYTIVSLLLIWKWRNKIKDKEINSQINLIFITILLSLFLGSLTDIIKISPFINALPQTAPVFILFPIWSMYYSAKNYGLIKKENINKDEIILKREVKNKLFNHMEYSFYIGGVIVFVFVYLFFDNNEASNLSAALIRSFFLFIMGFGIRISQRLKNETLKETFTMMILALSIPIISFQFLDHTSLTIWALPIIIIISSLVFNKKILLILVTIIAIVTQRLIWILRPDVSVNISSVDYAARIGIFVLAFLVANRINNIFMSKVRENVYQINFQKMNSHLSFDFIDISQENFDDKINNLLSELGKFFKVDCSYLFLINHENDTMTYSNKWCNTGTTLNLDNIDEIPLGNFPWWIKRLRNDDLIYIEDVNNMPEEAIIEKNQLNRRGVKSLLCISVKGNNRLQGFIGLDSRKSFKIWSNEHIELVKVISNLIASALIHMKSDREIEFMAYYDNLTKLPNRFLFSDRVNQAIKFAKRNKEFVSVVFMDLDDFKSVNDTMGHSGGDLLLQAVGKRLVNILRSTDTVGRFGGDEFMIMIDNLKDTKDTEKIAKKLMNIFSKPFDIYNQEVFITGSAGIAIYPIDGEDSEELIKNADTAMYQAKSKGKNQYSLCTKYIKDEVKENMTLSNHLYRALERDEFKVYYQPQIDLKTGKIFGIEALIRWIHPEMGMISPGVFIPLAEKNNLINSIGHWVLKTACTQNKKWQDMGLPSVKIGVNLSGIQFANPNITQDIEKILKETSLDPKYLELEITENIAIVESDYALDVLNRLKEIGVSIAIDDFGTKYSFLSRLKLLPIDIIKIDMQFIQGIERNKKDKAITVVIINLAKSLGLNVLAEGVETKAQLDFLNEKTCDYIQGYYYYKPMPEAEVEKLLKSIKDKDNI